MTTAGTSSGADRILVVGYGDPQHGDAAAGPVVAEAIAAKRYSHVVSLSVTQLVPELATLVASSRAVIFVDAGADDQRTVEVRELVPACPLSSRFHHTGPRELLAITRNCYGHPPLAWLVSVPRTQARPDDKPFAATSQHVLDATQCVEQLIDQLAKHEASHA